MILVNKGALDLNILCFSVGRNWGEGNKGSVSPLCLPGDDLDPVLSVRSQCVHHGPWLCHQLVCRFTTSVTTVQGCPFKSAFWSEVHSPSQASLWELRGKGKVICCLVGISCLFPPSPHFNVADETLIQNNYSCPKEVNNEIKFSHLHYCLEF